MLRLAYTLFFLLLFSVTAVAEVIYVHDERRLGVRPNANSTDAPLEVVSTGDRMELLGRSGDFVRVRTATGTEGWVNASFVSEDKPARVLLMELQQEHEILQQQFSRITELQQQTELRLLAVGARLEQADEMQEQMRQSITEYRAELNKDRPIWAWLVKPLLGLALFLFGVYLGVRWDRQRISERMGGLEL